MLGCWILLMLLALLNLFWETTTILDIENWLFIQFLYVIAGPMVLLFATSVIAAPAQTEQSSEGQSHYFGLCKRYFVMLALHEVWIIGIDYLYAALSMNTLLSAALLILFVVLAVSRSHRVHVTGASLAWAGYVVSVALRTLDTMGGQ